MQIAFRADASLVIGTGHIMRCLTLANALTHRGAERCTFVSRNLPAGLAKRVEAEGHVVLTLPPSTPQNAGRDAPPHAHWLEADPSEDAQQTLAALGHSHDAIVIDHYALDRRWGERVRAGSGATMLAIDDLGDRPLEADLLLDQNLQPPGPARYDRLLPEHCRTLLGPSFALLRPEFRSARTITPIGPPRVFVFLSGADPDDHTGAALRALAERLPAGVEVDAVVGDLHPDQAALSALCRARPGWTLSVNVHDMAERMARAHIAIGAGGSTTWERCAVGLPAVLVAMADNQVEVVRAAARAGVAYDLGDTRAPRWSEVAEVTASALSNLAELAQRRADCLTLVDGMGADRVAAILWELIRRRAGGQSPHPVDAPPQTESDG